MTLKVLYLVHDLGDAAVERRAAMLEAGGATVELAGFRRASSPEGKRPATVFGTTHDARFVQRASRIVAAAAAAGHLVSKLARPDIIVARNLEMLVLAMRLRSRFGARVPVVYECLDIHRLMLRGDALGKVLRSAERVAIGQSAAVMTSSPAFISEYFDPYSGPGGLPAPLFLVENKTLETDQAMAPRELETRAEGQPFRIGWFGALRCSRSLGLLSAFTRIMDGRYKVIMRGRPALTEFADFHDFIAGEPHIAFEGPYGREDMPALYQGVDFSWTIDFFEEGQNSRWLLPNRLYEGCANGAVPIAVDGTETARFLNQKNLGIILAGGSVEALTDQLGDLETGHFNRLADAVAATDRAIWIANQAECHALVARLEGLIAQPQVIDERSRAYA